MSNKLDDIIAKAMELNLEERAQLANHILISLDTPSESEIERLWMEEAERRLQSFRDGKTRSILASEVFSRAIQDLS